MLTHAHGDHVGSAAGLARQVPGLELMLSARDARIAEGDRTLDPGKAAGALRDLTGTLQSACAGRSGDAALRQMLKAYRHYARAHPGRYSATHRVADDRPDWADAGEALVAMIGQLLKPFQLGKTERIHAIRGLRSLAHGFVTLEAAHGFRLSVGPEASFEHLIATYLAGLQVKAGRG